MAASIAGGRADIVAGGEQMAGVQTHADAPRALQPGQQRAQLAERAADGAAAAGGVLQRHAHAIAPRPAQHLAARPRHAVESGLDAGAQMRAGMDRHAGQPQRLGALELVGEEAHRPLPRDRIGAGEVDQVAGVGEDGGNAGGPPRRAKGPNLVVAQRRRGPLPLVLDEDLHGETAERRASLERQVQSARDRHVGAELVGRRRRHLDGPGGGHRSEQLAEPSLAVRPQRADLTPSATAWASRPSGPSGGRYVSRSSIHVPPSPSRNRWRCSQRAHGPRTCTSTKR